MPDNGSKKGTLYVVATPIGNLGDMSERAVRVLSSVDVVAAEDTRHSRPLFNHFGIKTRMISLNEQNETGKIPALLQQLANGQNVALISDAGTPLISDPGFLLVRAVREAGFAAAPIPGASALIAALSVAGLPTDHFVFEGFLPVKSTARRKALSALADEKRTLVFYESVHRILDSLKDMASVLGAGRQASVSRELTKKFESISQGQLGTIYEKLLADPETLKGEFVIVVEGSQVVDDKLVEAEKLLKALLEDLPAAQAARITARITGVPRKKLYQMTLGNQPVT